VTDVYIEAGSKRVFACAFEWPGWCRSAKDEAGALETLAAYAERYTPVARRAGVRFDPKTAGRLRVVERIKGSANTDFGVPHEIAKADTIALPIAEAQRMSSLVKAAWVIFDEVVAKAPAELRKGPRGGGRDRDKIREHVVGADGVYARKLGVQVGVPAPDDMPAVRKFREAMLEELEKPSKGQPLVEKGWPQRYAARRIAWHALDHAWEIEDRSQ
jgi:hypothetical protein